MAVFHKVRQVSGLVSGDATRSDTEFGFRYDLFLVLFELYNVYKIKVHNPYEPIID